MYRTFSENAKFGGEMGDEACIFSFNPFPHPVLMNHEHSSIFLQYHSMLDINRTSYFMNQPSSMLFFEVQVLLFLLPVYICLGSG